MRIRELMMSDQRHQEEPGLRLYGAWAAAAAGGRHACDEYLRSSNQISAFGFLGTFYCLLRKAKFVFESVRLTLNFKQVDHHHNGEAKAKG